MKRQRRELQEASISFLDVISCGFGAIVLLLVIARVGDPSALEEAEEVLRGTVKEFQQQLFDVRGESVVLNDQLKARKEQLSELIERVARLKAKLASVDKQAATISLSQAQETEQLQLVMQILTEEMKRLVGPEFKQQNNLIGGIPVDSDYIIFVVDTSGSMSEELSWKRLKKEFINILDIYPKVKGLQIINTDGEYLIDATEKEWISDSPKMRQEILKRFDNWKRSSIISSPEKGLYTAIEGFYRPNLKISIYSFSDDFDSGQSVAGIIKTIDNLNRAHLGADRLVRIHNIGLPYWNFKKGVTPNRRAIKFANLLRELSYNNGGTFIGLNSLN
jgi:hypothetical protein